MFNQAVLHRAAVIPAMHPIPTDQKQTNLTSHRRKGDRLKSPAVCWRGMGNPNFTSRTKFPPKTGRPTCSSPCPLVSLAASVEQTGRVAELKDLKNPRFKDKVRELEVESLETSLLSASLWWRGLVAWRSGGFKVTLYKSQQPKLPTKGFLILGHCHLDKLATSAAGLENMAQLRAKTCPFPNTSSHRRSQVKPWTNQNRKHAPIGFGLEFAYSSLPKL